MRVSFFFKDLQNTRTRTRTSWKWQPLKHFKIISNMPKSTGTVITSVNVYDTAAGLSLEVVPAPEDSAGEQLLEMAINEALRSKRLLFQPESTSSILESTKFRFSKDFVALAIDSEDPYLDFRKSMEEMAEAYGLKYWEQLEELLALYLRMNNKRNHGFIVGAFIDLFGAAGDISSSSQTKSWWAFETEGDGISS